MFSSLLEGVGTGWTVYPPLILRDFSSSYSVEFGILSLHVAGAASIIGAVNYLSTVLKGRSESLKLDQVSVYI